MKFLLIPFFAVFMLITGCAFTYDAGAMKMLDVGVNPELRDRHAAKVTLMNDTTETYYFRMLDLTNGQVLTDDIQLDSGQSKPINPSADRAYTYIIFRNGLEDKPAYKCENAYFKSGCSYKLNFEDAITGKK